MCFASAPKAPPAPPPPAPPVAPIEIAPTEDAAAARKRKRQGVNLLQIPLTETVSAGLGIPKVL